MVERPGQHNGPSYSKLRSIKHHPKVFLPLNRISCRRHPRRIGRKCRPTYPPVAPDYTRPCTAAYPVMNTETMSILPRFSHTSGAEVEASRVPQHVITFVVQNREHSQRAAQEKNKFRAGLTSTKNAPLDNRSQINHAPALQALARPQQFIPGHQQSRQTTSKTHAKMKKKRDP